MKEEGKVQGYFGLQELWDVQKIGEEGKRGVSVKNVEPRRDGLIMS